MRRPARPHSVTRVKTRLDGCPCELKRKVFSEHQATGRRPVNSRGMLAKWRPQSGNRRAGSPHRVTPSNIDRVSVADVGHIALASAWEIPSCVPDVVGIRVGRAEDLDEVEDPPEVVLITPAFVERRSWCWGSRGVREGSSCS